MRSLKKVLRVGIVVMILPLAAQASDIKTLPIADALNSALAKEKLNQQMLYFADAYRGNEGVLESVEAGPRVQRKRGTKLQQSCDEAFVEALTSLQAQAGVKKATAVVNIHSYLPLPFMPGIAFVSAKEYQCEVGRKMVRVVLKGGLVRQNGANAATQSTASAAERLQKLKQLRKQGLIDEATYKQKEAEILKEL